MEGEFRDGVLRITMIARPPGLRVAGEVDADTLPTFIRALSSAEERIAGDIHADLEQLEFIDLGGIRTLMMTARRMEAGRSLVLHTVPDHVRDLITLIGGHETPGLRLTVGGSPR